MKKTMKKVLSGMLVFIFLLNFAILPANAEEFDGPDIGTAEQIGLPEGEAAVQGEADIPEGLLERIEGIESLPEILELETEGLQTYEDMDFECEPEEWQVLYLTNISRMYVGLEPLSIAKNLHTAADIRAAELSERFTADHKRPDGREFQTVLDEQGVDWIWAGENIARGFKNSEDVMLGWIESPGHLANILDEDYTHLGTGFYDNGSSEGPYWEQLFTGYCEPTGISVLQDADATYLVPDGSNIDGIGLVLQVECEHGTSYMPIIEAMCTGYDYGRVNETQTVTVSYGGFTAAFNIYPCAPLPFEDVPADAWFYRAVVSMYSNEIMTGVTENVFGPGEELSRGQFATILYRMTEAPAVSYVPVFSDVPDDDAFYKDAAIWAWAVDVITGYEDGRFGPSDQITREQMATMMYRYAEGMGIDVSARADLSAYPNGESVSSFAGEAMSWAVAVGLISGEGVDGSLNPQGNASRAVCATIIMRFIDNIL